MAWWHPKQKLAAREVQDLTEHLQDIPALYGQLPTLDEPDRLAEGEPNDDGAHTAPGSRAPINLTTVQLTDTRIKLAWRAHDPGRTATIHRMGTLPMLVWWTDSIARQQLEKGMTIQPLANPATVATECAWLRNASTFALAQPWATVYVRDIAKLHNMLMEATTGKREPWVPRCSACGDTLHARDDQSWYECSGCGKNFTPGSMIDLGRRQPAMTGAEIAAALGISPSTITTWRSRKLIQPARHDKHGRPLYYLADVVRIKERVRTPSDGK